MSSAPLAFDSAYVNALRHGDPVVEAHFVDHFNPLLLGILRRKVRSADQAREFRQETFLRVLTAVRSGRRVHKPERFEFFVINVCNNILRESYREQRRFTGLADLETEPVADFPSPYALVLAEETGRKVRRVLSQTNSIRHGILESVFLEGQDKEEICQRLGISRGYFRVLVYREKKRFGNRAGRDTHQVARRKRSRLVARKDGSAYAKKFGNRVGCHLGPVASEGA